MKRVLPIIVIAAALAAGAYVGYRWGSRKPAPPGPALVVRFLDADLGGGMLVQTPEERFVLIDPGPADRAEALIGYVSELAPRSVAVVITNPTDERAGALERVLSSLAIRRILRGGIEGRSTAWQRAMDQAEKSRIPVTILSAGDSLGLSHSVRLEALSPPQGLLPGTGQDPDANSLVVRLIFGRKRFLIGSDATLETEGHLIRSIEDLQSSVLVVPRGGGYQAASLELLSRVRPELCIVMPRRGRRPNRGTLARIDPANTGAALYRTDKNGTIDIATNGRAIQVTEEGRP